MSDIHKHNTTKSQTALDEESVLDFWDTNDIFNKSIEQRDGMDEFVFYDGPPFATGLPHYGHILPGTIKDVIPRYYTMKGKKVIRKWGWDCHGLPIENIIEKKLDLNSRKDILDYGIANFNKAAQDQVLAFKDKWEEVIPRTGRWVDMEDHYKTMDAHYTESCWWAFKELDKKGLVYKGYKPMHLCPRCETTLSNNEVAEGYEDITDISVTVKFELVDEPGTFLLAWTTTPWTLPGNTAIAVGPDVTYAKLAVTNSEGKKEHYILAQERIEEVMKQARIEEYEEVSVMGSEALVGRSYVPPFDYYYHDTNIEGHANGWKVYEADFVSDESGTGIAHEAPAFGADDYYLAQEHNIPLIHHVHTNGRFAEEVSDFKDMLVKAKDDHQSADIEIIKYLAHKGLLFSKEKITHAYPHCWRCDTPLLNYATSSWFIATTELRNRMLTQNSQIHWVPEHIGHKRFHNWIENNVDWAVSRSRFWGAPLPIWENQTTGEYDVIGTLRELQEKTRSTNNFIFIRHGESVGNQENIISIEPDDQYDHMTEQGKDQVQQSFAQIKQLTKEEVINPSEGVDVIVHSPFSRTRQTAMMIAEEFGVETIEQDERLRERYFGDGLAGTSYSDYYRTLEEEGVSSSDCSFALEGGESYCDVKQRMMDFLYEVDEKYEGKTILVVTHFSPYWVAFAGAQGMNEQEMNTFRSEWGEVQNAKPRVLDFAPLPCDEHYVLNMHRPYADALTYTNDKGEVYKLIGEVFDCWYESGSMPYASRYHLGEDTREEHKGKFTYPADFICEAIDQTRGWFYSLLSLGIGVFEQAPMKNVIVTGFVMAEDGKKMSKKLQNYPELETVFNKYGADALRYFLLSSPVMRGEKVNLVEKDIDEINKKIVMRLKNTLAFFQMYREGIDTSLDPFASKHPLDWWILARLEEVTQEATRNLDRYELDKACAPFMNFVDDLSTWYLRRSRERFKGKDQEDKQYAQATTHYVLHEFSKVLAPFMPFVAEHIFQELKGAHDNESVHLEPWPKGREIDTEIIDLMRIVRNLVSRGLELRVNEGIKVRQPLASVHIRDTEYDEERKLSEVLGNSLRESLRDELNVKEVVFDSTLSSEITLDFELNPQLRKEGDFREFVRQIQNMRKQEGLSPHDSIALNLVMDEAGQTMVKEFFNELEYIAGVHEVDFIEELPGEVEYQANNITYQVSLKDRK